MNPKNFLAELKARRGCILASHPECTESRLQGDLEAGLQTDPRSLGYGRDCANDAHVN